MENVMRDKNFIGSLAKGLAVMELLGDSKEPLTLTDVARLMETNKTSAQRFLNTLVQLGYVNRMEHKRYRLANKVLRLAHQFLDRDGLASVATPILSAISKELDKSMSLGVLDDARVLMIFREERARFHPYAIHAGSRTPCHCTTVGKLLLAALPDDELDKVLDRVEFTAITPQTLTSRQKLIKEFKKVREVGFSIADGEFSLDLYSFGVPVLDRTGSVIAAASISLNMNDKQDLGLVKKAKDKLFEAGLAISRGMGYAGEYPVIKREGQAH